MQPDSDASIAPSARKIKAEMSSLDSDDDFIEIPNASKSRFTNGLSAPPVKLEVSADDTDDDDADEDELDDDFDVQSFDGETEELFDDALPTGISEDICCQAEAAVFREQLRNIGPAEFCRVTVEAGAISAKKLLTAFGIRPPPTLAGQPDEAYYRLLSLAISRELSKRVKLPQFNTVDDAVALIKAAKNIIVLTGAGISTSLGIPDFRSKHTGLYSKLQHLGLNDPQEVFDINLFRQDPTIFYSVAKDILPDTSRFSPTHAFIALLQQKGKLLTNYSQNIDDLESAAGILPEKLIRCHGSFASATCIQCQWKTKLTPDVYVYQEMKKGNVPKCERCIDRLRVRPAAMKRKRSQNGQDKKRKKTNGYPYDGDTSDEDNEYDHPTAGIMKPDITFFGEALPDTFSDRLTNHDKHKVDLVIVIGTSLKVAPVSEVIPYLPANIPQMYISREPVGHVNFDIDLLGDCDVVVAELCRRAGWALKHDMIPENQEVNVSVETGYTSRLLFTEKK